MFSKLGAFEDDLYLSKILAGFTFGKSNFCQSKF